MSFTSPSSTGRARVGQQRHLARVLDRLRDLPLLLHRHAGHPAGTDLAAVGDELAQQRGVLVVDVADLRRLERVGLLLGLARGNLRHRPSVLWFLWVLCAVWGLWFSCGPRRGAR